MENQSLLLTLGVGVIASFALFFLLYKGLRWSGKLAALVTILVTQSIYIPLAALHWAGLDVFAIHFAFFTMTAYGLGIITSNRDARLRKEGTGTGGWFHWAPATIVTFFLLLAIVDSVIITLANRGASADFIREFLPAPQRESAQNVTSAFPGTVANNFQKKYDQYNNYLSQLHAQTERGWQVKDGWVEKPIVNAPAMFRIQVLQKDGTPINGARVSVAFLRPSNKALDASFELADMQNGTYGLPLKLTAPGLWTMVLTITKGDAVHQVQGETWIADQP